MKKALLGLSAAILLAYLAGVLLFAGRFPFRCYLNGTPVTFYTQDELFLDRSQDVSSLTFSLARRDGTTETVPFSRLGIYENTDLSNRVECPPSWTWPASLFVTRVYDTETSYAVNRAKLERGVMELSCVSYMHNPLDAYLEKKDGQFVIRDATDGALLSGMRVADAVEQAVEDGVFSVDLDDAGCYEAATIQSDDTQLQELCREGNQLLEQNVTVWFSDTSSKYELTESDLYNLILFQDGVFTTDSVGVRHLVERLCTEYGDVTKQSISFTCHDGHRIEIPYYESHVDRRRIDVDMTAEVLTNAILNGSTGHVDAQWYETGYVTNTADVVGTTYIEISIPEQHLWCYENGDEILDTDVTTGMDIPTLRTPAGIFPILDCKRDFTMYGSYGNAHVDYFLKLTDTGVGIHDASWRDVYGDTEYLKNGSHGCINTPYEVMEKLFTFAEKRFNDNKPLPVVIYNS